MTKDLLKLIGAINHEKTKEHEPSYYKQEALSFTNF